MLIGKPCFSMQDLRRIKQEGPRLEDVTQHWPFSFKRDNGKLLEVNSG